MVDKMRRDRDTNLAYNSFSAKQFTGILRSNKLEQGSTTSRERVTFNVSAEKGTSQTSRQLNAVAASPSSGVPPSLNISAKEYLQNQSLNKKGAYLQTNNMGSYEPLSARHQYKAIGWGIDSEKINHETANKQKLRHPKPTLKYLDNSKSSNFINFLHTKKNEINHQRQDYSHPRMFYLTKGKSSVAPNFQVKEKQFIRAEMTKMRASAENVGKHNKPRKHSASVPQKALVKKAQRPVLSPQIASDRSLLQSARPRPALPLAHQFRSGDLSKSVLNRAESAMKLEQAKKDLNSQTAQQYFTKEQAQTSFKKNGMLDASGRAQTEREYALRTFQINKEDGDTLRGAEDGQPVRTHTGMSSFNQLPTSSQTQRGHIGADRIYSTVNTNRHDESATLLKLKENNRVEERQRYSQGPTIQFEGLTPSASNQASTKKSSKNQIHLINQSNQRLQQTSSGPMSEFRQATEALRVKTSGSGRYVRSNYSMTNDESTALTNAALSPANFPGQGAFTKRSAGSMFDYMTMTPSAGTVTTKMRSRAGIRADHTGKDEHLLVYLHQQIKPSTTSSHQRIREGSTLHAALRVPLERLGSAQPQQHRARVKSLLIQNDQLSPMKTPSNPLKKKKKLTTTILSSRLFRRDSLKPMAGSQYI